MQFVCFLIWNSDNSMIIIMVIMIIIPLTLTKLKQMEIEKSKLLFSIESLCKYSNSLCDFSNYYLKCNKPFIILKS